MNYRIIEKYYGPKIKFGDWTPFAGKPVMADGVLCLPGAAGECGVKRSDYPYGGGGDVELSLVFHFKSFGDDAKFTAIFNADRNGRTKKGFRVEIDPRSALVFLRDEKIAELNTSDTDPYSRREIRLATLGMDFSLQLDGMEIAAGRMPGAGNDNEGVTMLSSSGADVRVLSFSENFIADPREAPAWKRKTLLYEESFSPESLRDNWMINTGNPGSGAEIADGGYVFHQMCNSFLRKRFDGPIAVDYVAEPLPAKDFSAGVTDAIFIWMLDMPEGDIEAYLQQLSETGSADLKHLLPLPLYWVDFGGSNNVTTRLRRNPGRHLMRQFTDPPRLLRKGRTYRITTAQIDDFLEFHVDGRSMISCMDKEPLRSGYVGVRAFCSDIRIKELKVWRIGE